VKINLNPLSLQGDISPAFVVAEKLRKDISLPGTAQENVVEKCNNQMDRIRILALQYKTIWMLKHSVVFNGIPDHDGYIELETIFIADRFWQKPDHSKQRWDREKELSPALNPFKKWLGELGLEFSAQGVFYNGREGLWLMVKKPSHKVIRSLFGNVPNEKLVLKGNKEMLRNEASPEYQARKETYQQYKKGLKSIDAWKTASLILPQLQIASLTGKDWVNISFAWRKKYIVRKKSTPLNFALQRAEDDWEKNLLLLRERLIGLGYTPLFRKEPITYLRRGTKNTQAFGVMVPR